MIKQLLNSVIAKYHDLSVSRRSIICLCLRLRQTIDLLANDKSRYFAQPRPIIVNYFGRRTLLFQKDYIYTSRTANIGSCSYGFGKKWGHISSMASVEMRTLITEELYEL